MPGFGLTPKSSDGVPLGTLIVPGNITPQVLKGSNLAQDNQGNYEASLCAVADGTVMLNQASGAQTASGNAGTLSVGAFRQLLIGFNITAASGTSPTIQFFLNTKGPDSVFYTVWTGSVYTVAPQKVLVSIGPGLAVQADFGTQAQISWTITGTTPSFTFSLWMIGK